MVKTVFVIIHSTYGHVKTMGQHIVKGLEAAGVKAILYRVPETLSADVLKLQGAADLSDIPVIQPEDMVKADGFLFGMPTRFGRSPAQMNAFWDATGGLWAKGELFGKHAGIFTSTGTQHGGLETTAFTFLSNFAHHGILFVPFGFASGLLGDTDDIIGGSAWGAGFVAGGKGERQLGPKDIAICVAHGKQFGTILNRVA